MSKFKQGEKVIFYSCEEFFEGKVKEIHKLLKYTEYGIEFKLKKYKILNHAIVLEKFVYPYKKGIGKLNKKFDKIKKDREKKVEILNKEIRKEFDVKFNELIKELQDE
jgi:hypothetical protein